MRMEAAYFIIMIPTIGSGSIKQPDEEEIRLVFTIETDADPELIGRRFFGLTDKVRTALGDDWRGYFPILQSEIDRGAAA